MKLLLCQRTTILGLALALCAATTARAGTPLPTLEECDLVPVADPELVSVETPLGTLWIETYSNVAPESVANFLGYIDRGDYADTLVHRITRDATDGIDVIQAGGFRFRDAIYEPIETVETVDNEPCILNVAGTVALAKLGGQPDSATSQWFVNITDNPALDDPANSGGFTVFGSLVGNSLDVAMDIQDVTGTPPDDVIPPYYAGVVVPLWDLYLATPLMTQPVEDPLAYGCFDVDQSGVLLTENPMTIGDLEPDPELDLPFTIVSYACTGGGAGAGAPLPCQDPGRRMIDWDPATTAPFEDAGAPFGLAEHTLSCDALTESLASYDARIADLSEQLDEGFVKTAYAVPEPGAGLTALAALAGVAVLGRSRSQPRRRRR